MRSIQIESQIGPDGVLRITVPIGESEAFSRVVVTIAPAPLPSDSPQAKEADSESLYGSCAGLGLEEPPDLPLPCHRLLIIPMRQKNRRDAQYVAIPDAAPNMSASQSNQSKSRRVNGCVHSSRRPKAETTAKMIASCTAVGRLARRMATVRVASAARPA